MMNKVIEIVPFIKALITEEAYLAGGDVLQNPEVYVLGNDGRIYQYYHFSLGRSAMVEIAKTPIVSGKTVLKPFLNPLPEGKKIPLQMLDDIVEFFKRVMKMTGVNGNGHGEYEAMAHIVWNKTTKSYRVAIPQQKVAKASVSYTWDHVKDDEEVVLDIHSHNTMGAFFSGTDESDDKTYAGISGVAGQLNNVSPALIWRFNAYRTKIQVAVEDIFAVPEKSVSPAVDDWMTNVEVRTYSQGLAYNPTGKVYGGGSRYGHGYVASERNPREDSWDARFRDEEPEITAGVRTSQSQASVDILGVDHDNMLLDNGLNWDDTVNELADSVWQEEDEELTAEIAVNLAGRIVDTEVLHQAGLFLVENSTDARKAIERLNKDFDIRSV